jgi:glutamate dehydrogenase/leucine dehydrogenase
MEPSAFSTATGHNTTLPAARSADFKGGEKVSNTDLLCLEADVLVPAAIEGVITSDNAPNIKAKMVVEGANQPTTTAADEILAERGIPVVPDILANAGGVVVSYFEWAQNIQQFKWKLDRVYAELTAIMETAYRATHEYSMQNSVTLRSAAYTLAIQRLHRAIELRGFLK